MTPFHFRRAIFEKPIELISALAMVGIGIALILVGPEGAQVTLGGVLATLGGVLLSWSAASVTSARQAVEMLRPQLESTSRHLGTVSGQISRVVAAVDEGDLDPATGFHLIQQANRNIYGIVGDLQLLTGTPLDTDGIVATIAQLDELAEHVSSIPARTVGAHDEGEGSSSHNDPPPVPTEIAEELRSIRTQLASHLQSLQRPQTPSRPERLKCPECGSAAEWSLGLYPGASASPHCAVCGSSFHAHRAANGALIIRRYGAAAESFPATGRSMYERILRDQGLRLVAPKWRRIALLNLVRAFSSAAGGRISSFEELDRRVMEQLAGNGHVADAIEVKKVRQLAYRAKVFDLNPTIGIGLQVGVTEETVNEIVDKNLVRRIVQFAGDSVDADLLNDVLTAGDPTYLEPAKRLISVVVSELASEAGSSGVSPLLQGG